MIVAAPTFVQHGSRKMPPPPYVHLGVKMHTFMTRGTLDLLQELCDTWFERPSGGAIVYKVLTSRLFIMCVNIASCASKHPDHLDSGHMPEIDVGIWMLVLRTKPLNLLPRWLPIHLLVDSAPAAFVGREVYGFPKQVGLFSVPNAAPASGPFSIQGLVVPAPKEEAAWKPVIDIRPSKGRANPHAAIWSSPAQMNEALVDILMNDDDGILKRMFTPRMLQMALSSVSMVFLKQFLDVNNVEAASYQGIVEAQASIQRFRGGGLTPRKFELNVRSYHSLPFERTLGLAPGWHKVGHGLWSDIDFTMHDGDVLWRTGT